jgi:hypothetical protein
LNTIQKTLLTFPSVRVMKCLMHVRVVQFTTVMVTSHPGPLVVIITSVDPTYSNTLRDWVSQCQI